MTLSALLFLVIGTGNVVMGYRKSLYFDEAVQAVHRKRLETRTFDPVLLEQLQSKQNFYRIVSMGGIGLLCVAACLLGVNIIRHRRP